MTLDDVVKATRTERGILSIKNLGVFMLAMRSARESGKDEDFAKVSQIVANLEKFYTPHVFWAPTRSEQLAKKLLDSWKNSFDRFVILERSWDPKDKLFCRHKI